MGQEEPVVAADEPVVQDPAQETKPEGPEPETPEESSEPVPLSRQDIERELECPLCGGLWFKGRCRDCGAFHNGTEIVKRDGPKRREEPKSDEEQEPEEPEEDEEHDRQDSGSLLDSWIG